MEVLAGSEVKLRDGRAEVSGEPFQSVIVQNGEKTQTDAVLDKNGENVSETNGEITIIYP